MDEINHACDLNLQHLIDAILICKGMLARDYDYQGLNG